MFWAEIRKISEFLSENFLVLVVKFSVYLNRHVFVMQWFSQTEACKGSCWKINNIRFSRIWFNLHFMSYFYSQIISFFLYEITLRGDNSIKIIPPSEKGLLLKERIFPKFLPFWVDPSSKWTWFSGNTQEVISYLPCTKWLTIYQVYLVP